ncbi:MAG: hypothetical protein QM658_08425 [Gordonia sp. (in: high G+C Gram-positive bacteria)]
MTINLKYGVANSNCEATLKSAGSNQSITRTKSLNLNASGVGSTTFTGLANGKYSGLRGNELAVVMNIARTYCPR